MAVTARAAAAAPAPLPLTSGCVVPADRRRRSRGCRGRARHGEAGHCSGGTRAARPEFGPVPGARAALRSPCPAAVTHFLLTSSVLSSPGAPPHHAELSGVRAAGLRPVFVPPTAAAKLEAVREQGGSAGERRPEGVGAGSGLEGQKDAGAPRAPQRRVTQRLAWLQSGGEEAEAEAEAMAQSLRNALCSLLAAAVLPAPLPHFLLHPSGATERSRSSFFLSPPISAGSPRRVGWHRRSLLLPLSGPRQPPRGQSRGGREELHGRS